MMIKDACVNNIIIRQHRFFGNKFNVSKIDTRSGFVNIKCSK